MPPPAGRIAKSRVRARAPDLLSALPADVAAQIIDRLREQDLRHVPCVCRAWARLFRAGSALEPALRALVAKRFGLRERPPCLRAASWGRLYLALRRERCHLCPAPDVAPFVYAGSSTLALVLHRHDPGGYPACPGLALFPICAKCFAGLMDAPRDYFVPVVERRAVEYVFPNAKDDPDAEGVETGYLYSDLPSAKRRFSGSAIEYVLARPLAKAHGCHRFHVPPSLEELDDDSDEELHLEQVSE